MSISIITVLNKTIRVKKIKCEVQVKCDSFSIDLKGKGFFL